MRSLSRRDNTSIARPPCALCGVPLSKLWRSGRQPLCRLRRLSGCVFQDRAFDKLRLLKSLACRAVKEDLVAIRLPNGRKAGCPRPLEAEINSAGLPTPREDPFGHRKCPVLELMPMTYGCADVFPKLVDTVDLLNLGQHFWQLSPSVMRPPGQVTRRSACIGENGINADTRNYRQNREKNSQRSHNSCPQHTAALQKQCLCHDLRRTQSRRE